MAFSTPRTEWLISPIYNLAGYQDIELGYTHSYAHAGSTATVKYSTNGGLSWQNLTSYNATTSGNIVTNIASWANGQANVRLAFVFTGTFVVGGASWRLDDRLLPGWGGVTTSGIRATSHPTPNSLGKPDRHCWMHVESTLGCFRYRPRSAH